MQEHLDATETLAGTFAEKFGLKETAALLARVHDFGKFSREFQKYLAKSSGDSEERSEARPAHGPDHSTAGAQFLKETLGGAGTLLAYAVAGHHAGLSNGIDDGLASLESRFDKKIDEWRAAAEAALPPKYFDAASNKAAVCREIQAFTKQNPNGAFALAFLIRMAFSCLVDADFLATEKFMNPEKFERRERRSADEIAVLEKRLGVYLRRFDGNTSAVCAIRGEVLSDCLDAAALPPGIFRLTVPTGGGKTLSSLAFALKHARIHGLERVIYAIPFTSIIEQNARVFRDALGDEAVLEHHCNAEFSDAGECDTRAKLAAENWDAPLIATTNVQFFESLFAHKTSRCRKLHNLAKSVVILDEAQALPPELLMPCLQALDELVRNYGTTVVLCTATQPAIDSDKLQGGLRGNEHGIREIIAPARRLHERLKRVSVEKIPGKLSDDALAEKLARERRVLAVVNTRGHARTLFDKLRNAVPAEERESVFHLSASMCPHHRTEILDEIRARLAGDRLCRVVSTQLVEAGVDVDFPCVYRAQAGIDSIAQAAGRCNREGRLGANGGRVFVFETDEPPPAGFLRAAADCGKEVQAEDLISPAAVERYFELMYWRKGKELDKLKALSELLVPGNSGLAFRFRDLGEKFRFIEDEGATVFVPCGEDGAALCEKLRETFDPGEQRRIVRKLQRFAVSIPRSVFNAAREDGRIQIIHERYAVLASGTMHYSPDFGVDFSFGGNSGAALCL